MANHLSVLRVIGLVGLLTSAVLQPAFGQDAYPNRTIKLIVPFAAGGNGDAVGRLTAYARQGHGTASRPPRPNGMQPGQD
jgi:tripartite-type tricarboxylate transporter receptor subunit TctC